MEQTSNVQLNQWEKTDRIQMEDFNADNAKIDAALALRGNFSVEIGTYVGGGTFGEKSPNRLTFQHDPLMVMVAGVQRQMLAIRPCDTVASRYGQDATVIYLTWGDRALTWYNPNNDWQQMNEADVTYTYYVLYATDQ